MTSQPIPIICDMTDTPDTAQERLAEYRRLFGSELAAANEPTPASGSGSVFTEPPRR